MNFQAFSKVCWDRQSKFGFQGDNVCFGSTGVKVFQHGGSVCLAPSHNSFPACTDRDQSSRFLLDCALGIAPSNNLLGSNLQASKSIVSGVSQSPVGSARRMYRAKNQKRSQHHHRLFGESDPKQLSLAHRRPLTTSRSWGRDPGLKFPQIAGRGAWPKDPENVSLPSCEFSSRCANRSRWVNRTCICYVSTAGKHQWLTLKGNTNSVRGGYK